MFLQYISSRTNLRVKRREFFARKQLYRILCWWRLARWYYYFVTKDRTFDCSGSWCIVLIPRTWFSVSVVIRWFMSFLTFSFMLIQSSFSLDVVTFQMFIQHEILTDIVNKIQWWGSSTGQSFIWLVIFSGTVILI